MNSNAPDTEIDIFSEPSKGSYTNNQATINTNSMPLGSRSVGSSIVVNNGSNNKMENIKTWSVSAYKCTKQIIQEKLGKSTKTVDVDLEIRIEKLRDIQRKFRSMHDIAAKLLQNFQSVVENQRLLAEHFNELGQQQPDLITEFDKNASMQRILAKQGEHFIYSLNHFVESIETLISKTISDTILTIKKYEMARLEYDAYRHELSSRHLKKPNQASDPNEVTREMELKELLSEKQKLFNQLRADVDVKINFLQENKSRVLHRQLVLFNQATLAYFSGNSSDVDTSLQQLRLEMTSGNAMPTSWIETHQVQLQKNSMSSTNHDSTSTSANGMSHD